MTKKFNLTEAMAALGFAKPQVSEMGHKTVRTFTPGRELKSSGWDGYVRFTEDVFGASSDHSVRISLSYPGCVVVYTDCGHGRDSLAFAAIKDRLQQMVETA